MCSSSSETVKSQSPDGDDSDLLADLTEEGKKVANYLEMWIVNEIVLVSCHVPLSFCVTHTLGLLFILSVGCAWGKEGGRNGRVGPPQCRCLGWHSSTGQSRDMKVITHNSGHQLSVCLHLKLFFSLFFFISFSISLPLSLFLPPCISPFFPLSETLKHQAGCRGKWSIS